MATVRVSKGDDRLQYPKAVRACLLQILDSNRRNDKQKGRQLFLTGSQGQNPDAQRYGIASLLIPCVSVQCCFRETAERLPAAGLSLDGAGHFDSPTA